VISLLYVFQLEIYGSLNDFNGGFSRLISVAFEEVRWGKNADPGGALDSSIQPFLSRVTCIMCLYSVATRKLVLDPNNLKPDYEHSLFFLVKEHSLFLMMSLICRMFL
jgi:hypothetical protein